jgi:hypothetical protein
MGADNLRKEVPIPACILKLPTRSERQRGFLRQLTDEQYWKAVFPDFNEGTGQLPASARTCTGGVSLSGPEFAGATPIREWPLVPKSEDLLFGSGPKRIKIVWFKTHVWPDGDHSGVLALVRGAEDAAEVYAVGTFKGAAKTTRFSAERLGVSSIVTGNIDGCKGKSPAEACESWLHLLVPAYGRLTLQASIATERRVQIDDSEPATRGRVSYRLTAAPIFEPTIIRLVEQIQGVDSKDRPLRTAELERSYRLVNGAIVESQKSLWDSFVNKPGTGLPSNRLVQANTVSSSKEPSPLVPSSTTQQAVQQTAPNVNNPTSP